MREKILKRQVKQTAQVRYYVRRSRIEQVISSVRRGVKARSWGRERSLLFLKEETVGGSGRLRQEAGHQGASEAGGWSVAGAATAPRSGWKDVFYKAGALTDHSGCGGVLYVEVNRVKLYIGGNVASLDNEFDVGHVESYT